MINNRPWRTSGSHTINRLCSAPYRNANPASFPPYVLAVRDLLKSPVLNCSIRRNGALWGGDSWPQPPFRRLLQVAAVRAKGCGQQWPLVAAFVFLVMLPAGAATSSAPTATPSSLNFTYQVNSATLPKASTVSVTIPSTASSVIYAASVYPAGTPASQQGWLTVTPGSGHGPKLSLTVVVNPTGLPPGSYTASVGITTLPDIGSTSVPVTFSISNPPSQLQVAPGPATTNFTAASGNASDTLSFTYTTGDPWVALESELDVATNGGIIPFNVSVANSGSGSSAVWLRVSVPGATAIPSLQTSGVANSGSEVPIIISLDETVVESLLPGSYGGVVTFAADNAVNGSRTVAVNLVVSAGAPVLTSIFPLSVVQAPAVDPLITINGHNFFSTSVATIAPDGGQVGGQCTQTGTPLQLSSVLLSQTVMQATIPKGTILLATPGSLCICVTNPAPANAPGQPPACTPTASTFAVVSSSQMAITSVLNAASFEHSAKQSGTNSDPVPAGRTSIAPGEIVSIFGQNLGPGDPQPALPSATAAILSSSSPLAPPLNTVGLTVKTLVFTVTNSAGVAVGITCDFASDTKAIAGGESLDDVVKYINQCSNANPSFSADVVARTAGGNYLTLTSPNTGAAASITVIDSEAARLFKWTAGAGNVSASGSATLSFPYQLSKVQVKVTYTDPVTGATSVNAPLIMVSSNQVNAMVPFEVSAGVGGAAATLTVLSDTSSASFANLVLVDENPGIFTLGGLGSGQAAVLNYSAATGGYTINSAKNTAARGSTVVIYATGLGKLVNTVANALPAATADKTKDPVQVIIGGQPAVVTYAGTSPGSIRGMVQINAIIPPTVTTGAAVSLSIAGGSAATARQSQGSVTLAVK